MSQPIRIDVNQKGSIGISKTYDDRERICIVVFSPDVPDFILQLARASNYSDSVISAMKAAIAEAESRQQI